MQRIHYRTRGGPSQGWGNVFRLAAFAEVCRQRGHGSATFFAEGPDAVRAFLAQRGFDVVSLRDGLTLEEEAEVLAEYPEADVTFVEMLEVTPARQRLLRGRSGRLVVFDDLCDHVYDADLVVCGQDLPSHANRELSSPATRFLIGYDYFLSRPEFLPYGQREREHAATLVRVLVTFGGGRYDVAYLKAARALARVSSERERPLGATFVLGFEERSELREQILAVLPHADVRGGVANLDELLWEHDLVIGSAGYTKLEAALTQTPQLMLSVQWHQIPLASTFAARTGVRDLGYMAYVEVDTLAAAVHALEPAEARRTAAARARSVVDGRGFDRVRAAAFDLAPEEVACTAPAA